MTNRLNSKILVNCSPRSFKFSHAVTITTALIYSPASRNGKRCRPSSARSRANSYPM